MQVSMPASVLGLMQVSMLASMQVSIEMRESQPARGANLRQVVRAVVARAPLASECWPLRSSGFVADASAGRASFAARGDERARQPRQHQ